MGRRTCIRRLDDMCALAVGKSDHFPFGCLALTSVRELNAHEFFDPCRFLLFFMWKDVWRCVITSTCIAFQVCAGLWHVHWLGWSPSAGKMWILVTWVDLQMPPRATISSPFFSCSTRSSSWINVLTWRHFAMECTAIGLHHHMHGVGTTNSQC